MSIDYSYLRPPFDIVKGHDAHLADHSRYCARKEAYGAIMLVKSSFIKKRPLDDAMGTKIYSSKGDN